MVLARRRPDWHALIFMYALGAVAAWHLIEDIYVGHWKVYSGEFYPERRFIFVGLVFYFTLACAEVALLLLLFLRIHLRYTLILLCVVIFIDNLGSFLNHRLLLALEFLLISLCPVPDSAGQEGFRVKRLYWNMDLVRFQLSLVYFITAVHKLNAEFTSGETLQNIFWMTRQHGMKHHPDWLFAVIQQPTVCLSLAWLTIALELALAFGLNSRRAFGWLLPLALTMHVGMALLMAYIKIFTVQVLVTLIVFAPDRVIDGGHYRLRLGARAGAPRYFANLLWPGYVVVVVDDLWMNDRGWSLCLPTGQERSGLEGWVELFSLSPLTFMPAEVLRAILNVLPSSSWRANRRHGSRAESRLLDGTLQAPGG